MDEQQEHLDLGPLIEPDPVLFQFETAGWYVVFCLIAIVVIVVAIKMILKYSHNAYRRTAISEMLRIKAQFESGSDSGCVQEANVILKQVAMISYGRAEVADLYGEEWLRFLDSKSSGIQLSQYEKIVSAALYEDSMIDRVQGLAFFDNSKKWIATHA